VQEVVDSTVEVIPTLAFSRDVFADVGPEVVELVLRAVPLRTSEIEVRPQFYALQNPQEPRPPGVCLSRRLRTSAPLLHLRQHVRARDRHRVCMHATWRAVAQVWRAVKAWADEFFDDLSDPDLSPSCSPKEEDAAPVVPEALKSILQYIDLDCIMWKEVAEARTRAATAVLC
jgi:hypothetical protein